MHNFDFPREMRSNLEKALCRLLKWQVETNNGTGMCEIRLWLMVLREKFSNSSRSFASPPHRFSRAGWLTKLGSVVRLLFFSSLQGDEEGAVRKRITPSYDSQNYQLGQRFQQLLRHLRNMIGPHDQIVQGAVILEEVVGERRKIIEVQQPVVGETTGEPATKYACSPSRQHSIEHWQVAKQGCID